MKNIKRVICILLFNLLYACTSRVNSEVILSSNYLLPRTLYFIKFDYKTGVNQIFKLLRDCKHDEQITLLNIGINYFDVSSKNGDVVYVDGKQLIILTSTNERKVIDSELPNTIIIEEKITEDNLNFDYKFREVNILPSNYIHPIWSSDGKYIAYYNQGIKFYSTDTEKAITLLHNTPDNRQYYPISFSPDNKWILLKVNYHSPAYRNYYLYSIETNNIKPLLFSSEKYPGNLPLGFISWSNLFDSLFISSESLGGSGEGITIPGLWKFDINGKWEPILESKLISQPYVYRQVVYPWQDRKRAIYFLFIGSSTLEDNNFRLAKITDKNIENPIIVRNEFINPIKINSDYLILPDGEGIILKNKNQNQEELILLPIDAKKPIITLLSDSATIEYLRWGPE